MVKLYLPKTNEKIIGKVDYLVIINMS